VDGRTIAWVLAPIALIASAVLVVLVVTGAGATSHHVSFVIPQASNLKKGLKVRAAGRPVGSISSVEVTNEGRAARVELELTDEKVWPLPRDSRLTLRYGGTISYAQRYVALARGTASGAPIADGGTVPGASVEIPVEFDEVLGTFDRRTRGDLGATLGATGAALPPAAPRLRDALGPAAGLTDQARGLFSDLAEDRSR
jgi:ABC-type transporter Mla subunit MlaD